MPQDSLRSVYKSFVPCDDPKGVAECNTVRKSLTKSHKIKNQKNSNTSPSWDEERKDKVEKRSTEDLQVREVSRGAQKLNEVIESFSSRTSSSKKHEYIAKDLLKGALDLQESLAMLRKLQETSQKSKKRDKEKPVGNDFMDFNPIEEYDHFQKPRTSSASSRDCYEELREVIVESFSRNNLLPKNSVHENAFFNRKSVDFSIDVPSSSSSQSWSSDCSSSRVHYQKPKGPNLIAKLMGLEEVSSKQANSVTCKQMETKGLSRHLLDFDLPKPRKPQFMLQKPVQERTILEEMIESMQFKVLVEEKSIGGPKHNSEIPIPPIVIMKPLHVRANYSVNDGKYSKSRRIMPMKTRDEFSFDSVGVAKEPLSFTQLNEKLPVRKAPTKLKDKQGDNSGEFPALPKKITNNVQDNPSSVKRRIYRPLSPSMQKEETIVKKIDGVTKMSSDTRKQAEIKPSRSRDLFNGQDLSKPAASKHISRPGNGSNVSKSQIARGKHTTTDKRTTPKTSLKLVTSKKNLKEDKPESNLSAITVESIPRDDDFPINLATNEPETIMESITMEQVPEEVTDASCNPISDNCENAESYPCEFSPSAIEHVKYLEDDNCIPYQNLYQKKGCKSISDTSYLLLCSASFLSHAKVLLDIGTGDPIDCLPGNEPEEANLLLECAKEIMERKSTCCTMFPLSLDSLSRKPKCHSSLDQLVSEISDAIEALISYSKCYGDDILVDSMPSVLKRDLWWNGEMNGVWESGWRNGFSAEEVNEVANDLQNLLLIEMVEDMVTEIVI